MKKSSFCSSFTPYLLYTISASPKNTTQYIRPGFEPGLLGQESSELNIVRHRGLHDCSQLIINCNSDTPSVYTW